MTENPISEGGNWINGKAVGLDWSDVRTVNGMAVGLQPGTSGTDDATALLTGTWGPNQTVTATVHTTNPSSSYFEEVELRLRSTLSAHRCTGYEVLFGLRNDSSAYVSIVRWNGPFNDWTTLDAYGGTQYILRQGDVVMGVISNQTISAYINGVKVMQVTDSTFSSGNPGLGFYLANATGVNTDYGFTSFTASDEGSPPMNNPPVAHSQSVSTTRDSGVGISLTGHDPENNPLTYTVVGSPTQGTLGGTAPNLTYWPAAGYSGSDSFTFKVNDGQLDSTPATVSITVTAGNNNSPPTANSQNVSTPKDTSKGITLSGTDPENNFLYYSVAAGPLHGTLSGTAPNLIYRPAPGYTGPDSFNFYVYDGTSWSAPGTVAITVTATANSTPTANSQSVTTPQDTTVTITLTGTDPENQSLYYSVSPGPSHGTLSGTPPNITYRPAAGYIGPDSFNFYVTDGNTWSAPGTVSISVTSAGDPPPAALLRSTGIALSTQNVRGNRATLVGVVTVKNQDGLIIPSATVAVRWTLPSGSSIDQTGTTSSSGTASFNTKSEFGTATLTVISISKLNHTFDPGNSVLSQSITTSR